jgi:hypothetical protein
MSTREAIIESLTGSSVTSFRGRRPTATDIDTLEKELAVIAARIKTSLFQGEEKHTITSAMSSVTSPTAPSSGTPTSNTLNQKYQKPTTRIF